MRKIILLLMSIIIFTGCTKKVEPTETIYISERGLLNASNEVVNSMLNEDKNISNMLADDFKEKMPGNTLLKVFKDYTDGLTLVNSDTSYIVNDTCVYNYLDYENKTVKIYTCFNDNLKVKSLIINDLVKLPNLVDSEYFKEDVVLVGNSPQLNGVLTMPKNIEKPPVVVMVQGSGPSDLNETVFENKPFEDIAHGLAMQGIASIRFDKRTYAFPESIDLEHITLNEEYFYDVSSAIHILEKYSVDPFKIYYLGHSLGGMISFSIMEQHPELKGAIVLAGSPRSLEDIIYDQVKNSLASSGLSGELLDKNLESYVEANSQIKVLTDASEHSSILGINSEYWYSLNQNSFEKYKKIDRKFLILQGEKDVQVFFDKDFELFKQEYSKNKNVTLKSYENLNHLFMESSTESVDDYKIKSNVSDEVINDLVNWINGKDILKVKK